MVKRYVLGSESMEQWPDGHWVLYKDYEKVYKALKEARERLKECLVFTMTKEDFDNDKFA